MYASPIGAVSASGRRSSNMPCSTVELGENRAIVASATGASSGEASMVITRGREGPPAMYAPEMPTHAPSSRIVRAAKASAQRWRKSPQRRCTLTLFASQDQDGAGGWAAEVE